MAAAIIKNILNKSGIWPLIRRYKIINEHKRIAREWQPIINSYYAAKVPKVSPKPLKQYNNEKLIWQYWGQGLEHKLPEVVQLGFDSVDKYKGDYTVIRLSDETVADYVTLPDYVYEKFNKGNFNRTFFSDLLRLALLTTYGGVWLDATILLTGPLSTAYHDHTYFVFQRSAYAQHKTYWQNSYAAYWGWYKGFKVNMLNSIMFAHKHSELIADFYNLMLEYWRQKDAPSGYFFFQILYHQLVHGPLANLRCPITDDTLPHLLQTKVNGGAVFTTVDEILSVTPIHKLSYFNQQALTNLKEILKK